MKRLVIFTATVIALGAGLLLLKAAVTELVALPAAEPMPGAGSKAASPNPSIQEFGVDRPMEQKRISKQISSEARGPALPESEDKTPDSGEFDRVAALYPELGRIMRLEEQDRDQALRGLSELHSNPDPVVRLAALESLADLDHSAKVPALLAALDDPDPQIRGSALEALTLHGDSTIAGIIEGSVFDQEPAVRVAAIDALAALGNPISVPVLGALLYDPDRRVRISAVAALGEIGGADSIAYLRQMRYDPDDAVRFSVNAILAEEAVKDAF